MDVLEKLIDQTLDDKYRIEERLGRGGMGAVYLATHLGTQRPVALKVIAPEFMTNPEFVERFKREAEAAGRLHHANVVNVTDFGFADAGGKRIAYLVMEYLEGCSLGEVLEEEKRLPLAWVVDIVEQVCSAIEEAHQQGIIHRDLKPDNIWLKPNRRGGYTIKVLDFGLAKLAEVAGVPDLASADASSSPSFAFSRPNPAPLSTVGEAQSPSDSEFTEAVTQVQPPPEAFSAIDDGETTLIQDRQTAAPPLDPHTVRGELTRVGSVIGTPLYMSPEQCRGETLGSRSDIYSLGVITYQMLSGQTPFKGNMHTLVEQHMEAAAPPLGSLRRDIPKPLAGLVMSALAKNPPDRPASAAAFANALRANSEGAGALLRQAFALYSEHFPTFVRISLIGHIPFIIFTILQLLNKAQMNLGIMPRPIGNLFAFLIGLLVVVSNLFAKAVNQGAFVPVVAQLRLAPLREIKLGPIFSILKKRLRPLAVTAVKYYVKSILLLIPLIVPGIMALINYSLYAPVVMMEGLSGKAALERSKKLVNRSKRVVVIILALYVFIGANLSEALAKSSMQIIDFLSRFSQIVIPAFGILVDPLFAIAFAMLYFKTRQAGGETLNDILGSEYEGTGVPASRWQQRMRERVRSGSRTARLTKN